MTRPVDILLVDDHEENLLALEAILTDESYNLVRARSGREALREVLARDFAIILLDVAMPHLDGYETASIIRQRDRSRDTPIIFLTANYRTDTHVFRGYSVGAVDYIFKPFSPDVLKSKVAVFVELYTKREALKRHSEALQRAHDELEDRVRARTREIATANEALRAEIVERERIERERLDLLEREQRARAEAESVNRLKDEFLATLSHELRTPLNAILGWSHLLTSGRTNPATSQRALNVIRNNAMAQSQLIEDILDVSRIISGKLRIGVRAVDLAEVLDAALDSVSPAVDAKGITIERDLEPLQPIAGDPDRLQQVFWNLLSNAVKFTPSGGKVEVWLGRAGTSIQVRVSDTGQGIDASFLPHVFERFRQADSSASRLQPGLGLGLAIVRQLVEMHAGTVKADSPGKGQGSTFEVSLPVPTLRRVPPTVAPAEIGTAEAWTPSEPTLLEGLRVLIVEDDEDGRDVLKTALEQCGATVTTAASAAEALLVLSREVPDILVSDIGLPGQDGYELLQEIRKLPAERGGRIPAVALTAYAGADDKRKSSLAGFQAYLAKPAEPAELIAKVAALAGRAGRP